MSCPNYTEIISCPLFDGLIIGNVLGWSLLMFTWTYLLTNMLCSRLFKNTPPPKNERLGAVPLGEVMVDIPGTLEAPVMAAGEATPNQATYSDGTYSESEGLYDVLAPELVQEERETPKQHRQSQSPDVEGEYKQYENITRSPRNDGVTRENSSIVGVDGQELTSNVMCTGATTGEAAKGVADAHTSAVDGAAQVHISRTQVSVDSMTLLDNTKADGVNTAVIEQIQNPRKRVVTWAPEVTGFGPSFLQRQNPSESEGTPVDQKMEGEHTYADVIQISG